MKDNISKEGKNRLIQILDSLVQILDPEYFSKNLGFLVMITNNDQIEKDEQTEKKLRKLARENIGECQCLLHLAANCFSNIVRDLEQISRNYIAVEEDHKFLLNIAQRIKEGRITPDKTIENELKNRFARQSVNYCNFFIMVADLFGAPKPIVE